MSTEVDLLFKSIFPQHADPTDAPALSADESELQYLDDIPANAADQLFRAARAEKEKDFYPFRQAHPPAVVKVETPLTKTQQAEYDRLEDQMLTKVVDRMADKMADKFTSLANWRA